MKFHEGVALPSPTPHLLEVWIPKGKKKIETLDLVLSNIHDLANLIETQIFRRGIIRSRAVSARREILKNKICVYDSDQRKVGKSLQGNTPVSCSLAPPHTHTLHLILRTES